MAKCDKFVISEELCVWPLNAKLEAWNPSNKSASNPEPEPSTVLIAVKISEAVWSAVAFASIPDNFVFSASVKAFVSELLS